MSWSGGGGGGLPQDPVTLATAATALVGSRVVADTVDRYQVLADGTELWGPGNGAADLRLFRIAASLMVIDSNGNTPGGILQLRSEGSSLGLFNSSGAQNCGSIGRNPANAGLVVGGGSTDGSIAIQPGTTNGFVRIGRGSGSSTVDLLQVALSSDGVTPINLSGYDKAGHSYTRKQTANTATVAANNGTTALSLSATSTDEAGTVTFTPANALAADSVVFTVTFATAYANTPVVTLTANGSAAGGLGIELGSVSTTGFSVALHVPPAVGAASAINYSVKGL